MSPIKDIQERYRELGRLRMGEVVETNGKKRPGRLDTWRLTSPSQALLEGAAGLWGGEVSTWENAPTEGEQYELTTDVSSLPVLVPPQDIDSSTWLELWSGSGRKRMCDGEVEALSGKSCICATKDRRECKPTTQVKVILPDIPDMGTWRLVTHGWNAAAELTQTVRTLNFIGPNTLHHAKLTLQARTTKTEVDGKPETHHFIVPVLELPFTFGELIEHAPPALTAGRSGRVGLPGAPPELPVDSRFEHDRETDWGAPVAPPQDSEPESRFGGGDEGSEPISGGNDGGANTVAPPVQPSEPPGDAPPSPVTVAVAETPVADEYAEELDDDPAADWRWKNAVALGITGAKALKGIRAGYQKAGKLEDAPRTQSEITNRQLQGAIEGKRNA